MKQAFARAMAIMLITASFGSVAAASNFVDGLALPLGRSEFMKRFPLAKQLSQKENPARETLAVPSTEKLSVGKYAAGSILRSFVGGASCAAGAGFGPMSTVGAKALVGLLKGRHEKLISEVAAHDGELAWTFMSDVDTSVGILLKREDEEGRRYVVTYAVVLNSCPPVVAREYQVVPRQK